MRQKLGVGVFLGSADPMLGQSSMRWTGQNASMKEGLSDFHILTTLVEDHRDCKPIVGKKLA